MAKKAVRVVITLACTECKERNYTTEKNRRNDQSRMELKKYCPRCRYHTAASGDEVAIADALVAGMVWPWQRHQASCSYHRPVAQLAEQRSPKP